MSQSRCILVAFGEALAAPEACYSLVDAGFRVVAACRRRRFSALWRSRLVETCDVTPPEEDVRRTCLDLLEVASDIDASVTLPLDDASLWIVDHIRGEMPCRVAVAPHKAIGAAMDKRLQLTAAEKAGFLVPRSRFLSQATDVAGWREFPCTLKAGLAMRIEGAQLGRLRAEFCATESALIRASEYVSSEDPVILQSWHQGVGIGVFGFRTDAGVRAWSGHRRIRMMNPAGSGSSCCEATTPSAATRAVTERFLESIGWRGLFMVELLRDTNGQDWFMELNGRTWGSTALARAQGLEYPAWAVLHALGELPDLPAGPTRTVRRARHLGLEIMHLLFVLRGPGRHMEMPWPKRIPTIRQLLRGGRSDRWYNAQAGDMAVFGIDMLATLYEQIVRRPARKRIGEQERSRDDQQST